MNIIILTANKMSKMEYEQYISEVLNQIKSKNLRIKEIEEKKNVDIYNEIRMSIIKARREQDLTQVDLAKLSGVSQANISRIENGKMKPSIDVLQKLADGMSLKLVISFENK